MEKNEDPVYKDERYGKSRELFYSYGQDGQFEKKVDFQRESVRVVAQQAWDLFNERIEEARQKVLAGKASPLVYYMEKSIADPSTLSGMAGIPLWRVKWHFKPGVFKRLNEKTLKKYAEAFQISIEQLRVVQ
jgi:hypothetical protein